MLKNITRTWTRPKRCCICGAPFENDSPIGRNNPRPLGDDCNGDCCDACNEMFVIPARIMRMRNGVSMRIHEADEFGYDNAGC